MAAESIADMAYQYTLACQTLQSSLRSAGNSSDTNAAKTTALKTFADTLSEMLPEDVTASPQYQYYDAMFDYQAELYSAQTAAERDTALKAFYTAIGEITAEA
ncbi:hypothetical protein G3N56_10655 [Desulfovibrio sulfodismutans]|uniref:Uncharacterized protein n=1 Tax=Desulfolutivibrio sulfodismutans TaxID=63561 RepID=A0A7K3NPS1_9BACT|nr:hypothetical protein [Desulfolutivibrio sulfodismutans]NDY57199.1 hypothetical protein [Desulfolutivibrio sulfodismutans]QLA13859.1 hypothetical protein GD606_17120 [Desulfolutivibrio sulfodismutans DSM 3696]